MFAVDVMEGGARARLRAHARGHPANREAEQAARRSRGTQFYIVAMHRSCFVWRGDELFPAMLTTVRVEGVRACGGEVISLQNFFLVTLTSLHSKTIFDVCFTGFTSLHSLFSPISPTLHTYSTSLLRKSLLLSRKSF